MLRIAPGRYQVWPRFALNVLPELSFEMDLSYRLRGENGSGKSSFLHHVLLPAITASKDKYVLYLQQQMYLQLYAIQAHAAIHSPGRRIAGEQDAIRYLCDDLKKSHRMQPRDIYVLADESTDLAALQELSLPHCLIYIAHHESLPNSRELQFSALGPEVSEVIADV